jgi:hypothetical protein
MNPEFIKILKKLVTEQGKDVLFNSAKCKAFLADYTHGEYKKESRLLIQTIEAGVPKAIDVSDNLSQCKQQQIRVLREDYFLAEEIAEDVINTIAHILNKSAEQTTVSPRNKPTSLDTSNIVSEEHSTISSQNNSISSNKIDNQIPSNTLTEERQQSYWLQGIGRLLLGLVLIIVMFTILALVGLIK